MTKRVPFREPAASKGRVGHRQKFSIQAMCEAIRQGSGLYSEAARILTEGTGLGCHRTTVHYYVKKYPEVRAVLEEVTETELDASEMTVMRLRRNEEDPAVALRAAMYHLNNQGKGRGYGDVPAGPPPVTNINVDNRQVHIHMSPEAEALLEEAKTLLPPPMLKVVK